MENAHPQAPNGQDKSSGSSIISLLSHLVALPLFIFIHRVVPDPAWPLHLHRILLFFLTVFVVELVFSALRGLVIFSFWVAFFYLLYGSIWGSYGFGSLFQEYKELILVLLGKSS